MNGIGHSQWTQIPDIVVHGQKWWISCDFSVERSGKALGKLSRPGLGSAKKDSLAVKLRTWPWTSSNEQWVLLVKFPFFGMIVERIEHISKSSPLKKQPVCCFMS
jgi:hypothetical protein